MKLKSTIAIAVLVGLAGLAPAAAAGGGTVEITMGAVMVDTATAGQAKVTVNVENIGTARIKVDLNVIALGKCTGGDLSLCDAYNCTREGVASVDGVSLGPGDDANLMVTIPLDPGTYLFRARVTGAKGGNEDQKFGVTTATVM